MDLCVWSIDIQGGENQETVCEDGSSISTGTVDECTSSFSGGIVCDVTVAEAEACLEAVGADPCNAFSSVACEPLFSCAS